MKTNIVIQSPFVVNAFLQYCIGVTLTMFILTLQPLLLLAAQPSHPEIYTAYTADKWEEITNFDERIKIYNLIYESCESNYSKLATWQATYKLDTYTLDSDDRTVTKLSRDYQNYMLGQVDFSIDFHKDCLHWKYQVLEHKAKQETPINFPVPVSNNHEITADELAYQVIYLPNTQFVRPNFVSKTGEFQPLPGYKLVNQNVVNVFSRTDIRPSRFSQHTGDPRFFYNSLLGGDGKWTPMWSQCKGVPKILRGEYGEELQKSESPKYKVFHANRGNEILYKLSLFEEGKPFQESIYSDKARFNLVFFVQYSEFNNPGLAYALEYTQSAGIMIPMFYSVFHGPGGFLIEYQLQNSKLNKKLPKDIFEIQSLGIKNNDVIFNYQEKVNYIFKKGKLVRLSAFGEKPDTDTLLQIHKEEEHSSTGRITFIVLMNVIIVVLGIYLWIHSKKR
ncbi:MAG: hypothetical protein LBF88_02650 [Planctomycetaceae bacterium]|jgi:hypothetical protein|nr:hypothetical protein [Planctomycetaceae bacterium]